MRPAILSILFLAGVARAQTTKGSRCDSGLLARAIPAERTVTLGVTSPVLGARIPRPLADNVLEALAESFKMPASIALQVYSGPVRFPSDSSDKGKREWAHPSLDASLRLTLARSGVPRRIALVDKTYDIALDSAFVTAVRVAVADSVTVAQWLADLPGDSTMLDIELRSEGAMSRKERTARNKVLANGELLVLPISRIVLPHYPEARALRFIRAPQRPETLSYEEFQALPTGRVVAHAVVDTTGHLAGIWIPEAANREVESKFLARLREIRFYPATVGGCPVPTRIVYSADYGARIMPSRPMVPQGPPRPRP